MRWKKINLKELSEESIMSLKKAHYNIQTATMRLSVEAAHKVWWTEKFKIELGCLTFERADLIKETEGAAIWVRGRQTVQRFID